MWCLFLSELDGERRRMGGGSGSTAAATMAQHTCSDLDFFATVEDTHYITDYSIYNTLPESINC